MTVCGIPGILLRAWWQGRCPAYSGLQRPRSRGQRGYEISRQWREMPMPPVHAEQRLQSLLEITYLLMRAVDPDEVLTVILSAALRLCDAEGCSLALLDPTGQELAFVAMAGPAKVEGFHI